MDIETLRSYCLSLLGTTEDIKFGDNLCFLIEEKIYCMCALSHPPKFCLKVNPEEFDELVSVNGISQAAYMAKKHWIEFGSLEVMSTKEFKERIKESRALVLKKLPKYVQLKYV